MYIRKMVEAMLTKSINSGQITLLMGDITEMQTDAIVNAANSYLQHGGGVAGAIVRKGGMVIQEESNKIGHTPVGTAVITSAGKLKAKYVIHAVGPRMGEGNEDEKLKSATLSSLQRATEKKMKSIAFPAISTGIFGYPIDRCAAIMLETTRSFLTKNDINLDVVFCLWTKSDYMEFEKVISAF